MRLDVRVPLDLTALAAGLAAGLAIAVPLGPIGVLLVSEGATRGWRGGLPAASAVATLDVVACTLAVLFGSALAPVIAAWGPWPRVVGGLALVVLACVGLWRALGNRGGDDGDPPSAAAAPDPPHALAGSDAEAGSAVVLATRTRPPAWRRFALFFGLTAMNPPTLIYFAAVVTGLGSIAGSVADSALFILGVGLASLTWQSLLVGAGAILHRRSGPAAQRWTALIGNAVIAVLGVGLMLGLS